MGMLACVSEAACYAVAMSENFGAGGDDAQRPLELERQPRAASGAGALAVEICALCSAKVAPDAGSFANGRRLCEPCTMQVEKELDEQAKGGGSRMLPAVALGAAGAALGALAWAAIAIATDLEVGYVAVLVGFLAGYGVKMGAGRARGTALSVIAVGWSIIGLALAKYFIFAYVLVREAKKYGVSLSYFDGRVFSTFWDVLPKMLSPFDALWLILAIGAAARQLKPTEVTISR